MTIIVDSDSCTRCGICSNVCPMGIINPSDGDLLPQIHKEKEPICISCGQCDSFCPSGALSREEKPGVNPEKSWDGTGLSSELLSSYIRSRRSIRNYLSKPVDKKIIESILDVARYAASGGNGQPVEWMVILNLEEMRRISTLIIDWLRTIIDTVHPMSAYAPRLVAAWDSGEDVIFRGAPHLLIAHIPEDNPIATVDGIIAMTHVDIVAPSFGIGTCWGGFVSIAATCHPPLVELFGLPEGRKLSYAMMFGYPKYRPATIPERKPVSIIWKE